MRRTCGRFVHPLPLACLWLFKFSSLFVHFLNCFHYFPPPVMCLQEEDAVLVCFQQDLLFNVSPNDILLLLRDAETALLASVARLRPAPGRMQLVLSGFWLQGAVATDCSSFLMLAWPRSLECVRALICWVRLTDLARYVPHSHVCVLV
jgi:hypothetical protein